uniref:Reverse transcriptase domain-containing protein n=1 Tax=Anolis carolinensis TaxID=28377 RepID=A0A803TBS9_ANOCA
MMKADSSVLIECIPSTHVIQTRARPENPKGRHGFTINKSRQTNQISFFDRVTSWVDTGNAVDVAYLDFSKAFDKVPHGLLANKLVKCGLDKTTVRWICNWLSKRTQRVLTNALSSSWKEVTSGVPQGSILGPVLFNIFINDLDEGLEGSIIKFADDTKLGGITKTPEDRNRIQNDLNRLERWAETNKMKFNRDKCKILHFGRKNGMQRYRTGDAWLDSSTYEKDLGVLMDNKVFFAHTAVKPGVPHSVSLISIFSAEMKYLAFVPVELHFVSFGPSL